MKSPHCDPLLAATSGSVAASTDPEATGLLISRDLIFTTKVKGTAAALGYRLQVAGEPSLIRSFIVTSRPRVVFVDLTAGELVAPGALSVYLKLAGPDVWFVAFGPHVEAEALAAAKAAGCHAVLTRSKFSAELPELIRHYFGRPVPHDGRIQAGGE
jgi:hypothetical protein